MEHKNEHLEQLKEKIENELAELKESWSEFPEDWKREDLQSRCDKARFIWHLIEASDDLVKGINRDFAREEAQKIRLAGHDFDKIEIDGFRFYVEGALVLDEWEG
jgi:hypothetical protein